MIKKIKYAYIFIFILISNFSYSSYCEQNINVKFTPISGIRLYRVTGGEGNSRSVLDLGHFNGDRASERIKIGTIKVDINMVNTTSEKVPIYDVQVVNVDKLKDTIWKYTYDITTFINDGDGVSADIKLENLEVYKGKDIIVFDCDNENHNHSNNELSYSFDLILELNNLNYGSMYGISSLKKEGVTEAYVNFRDLIVDQLIGSAVSK